MVLTVNEYVNVCVDAYLKPVLPADLVIPDGTAHHESIRQKAEHDNLKRMYNEATDVKRAVKKLIAQALDRVYVMDFRDTMTSQMNDNIPVILEELFQ